MSSMRDAGFVLVLLLLAATIRVDQPVKATLVPDVQAAAPASQAPASQAPASRPAELPAVEKVGVDSEPQRRRCGERREVRVVHLEDLAKSLDLGELPTIVLDSVESQMRFVFVESDAPPARLASPVTVG